MTKTDAVQGIVIFFWLGHMLLGVNFFDLYIPVFVNYRSTSFPARLDFGSGGTGGFFFLGFEADLDFPADRTAFTDFTEVGVVGVAG